MPKSLSLKWTYWRPSFHNRVVSIYSRYLTAKGIIPEIDRSNLSYINYPKEPAVFYGLTDELALIIEKPRFKKNVKNINCQETTFNLLIKVKTIPNLILNNEKILKLSKL